MSPVEQRLIDNINAELFGTVGGRIRPARTAAERDGLGRFIQVNRAGRVVRTHVDLQAMGRELGVLR